MDPNLSMSLLIFLYSSLSTFVTSGQSQAEVCPTPSTKNNGVWWCNEDQNPSSYCYLKCDPGYAALFTSTSCIGGAWTDLDKMECESSVLLLIGGLTDDDKNKSSEIFHDPGMENVTCTNHLPYLEEYWLFGTSFVHNGLLYSCGFQWYDGLYGCASFNMTDQSGGQWKYHIFSDAIKWMSRTIMICDKLYFIDEYQTGYTVWTTLPLENEPKLNGVHSLPFLFGVNCLVQTTGDSFIVIGDENIYGYNKAVINYNESTAIITEYPRPKELPKMWDLDCVVVEEGGKEWLVLVADFDGDLTLATAKRLDLNDGTQWESLGQLNVPRNNFKMGVKGNRIFAIGGYNIEDDVIGYLDTVEVFDWESQKWKLIEQKLNTGRLNFGKVEVPASIFNCEKN